MREPVDETGVADDERRGGPGPGPDHPRRHDEPDPDGHLPVAWKDQEHTSSIYDDPMPYSVFFAPGGYAFHEGRLDEDSHGCIRLEMSNAQTFFNTLQPGQLVQVAP